ncbi:MAG: MFS transporter [Candidatus Nanohaloarchaea archaeon]
MHISEWMERIDLGKEIQEVYIHSFMFKLAVNLVTIFLPLYVLELGYSVRSVFLFFLVYYGAYVVASFPNAKVASRLGYKHASLASSPVILLFYLMLRADLTGTMLYGVAVVGGYGFNLYWSGMNPEVARSTHGDDREEETGYFFSMPTMASMLSPAVGGLVLSLYGFPLLFLVAAVLIGGSFVPFLFSGEHHEGNEMDPTAFFHRAHLSDFMTFAGKGINSIGKKVLWPLYLALVIQSSTSIGGAGSLLALGGAVASITLGKVTGEDNRGRVITSAVAVTAVSYLFMSQVTSPGPALAVSFINGLGRTGMSLPIYSRAQEKAEEEDYVEYFAFREFALSAGRVVALAAFLIVFTAEPSSFTAGFAGIAASLSLIAYFGKRF